MLNHKFLCSCYDTIHRLPHESRVPRIGKPWPTPASRHANLLAVKKRCSFEPFSLTFVWIWQQIIGVLVWICQSESCFNYACYILCSSPLCAWIFHICSRRIIPSREDVACKDEGLELEARIPASARSAGTPWGHYATCPHTNPRPRFLFLLLLTSHFVSLEMSCVPVTLFCNSFLIPFFCQFSLWSYWFTLATLSRLLTRLLNVRQMPLCVCRETRIELTFRGLTPWNVVVF
jgi:hypothetical protein